MDKVQANLQRLIDGPTPKPEPAPPLDVNALAQAIVEAARAAAPRVMPRAPHGWRVQVVRREGLIEEFLVYPMDARP